jgi:hypothetical protein
VGSARVGRPDAASDLTRARAPRGHGGRTPRRRRGGRGLRDEGPDRGTRDTSLLHDLPTPEARRT